MIHTKRFFVRVLFAAVLVAPAAGCKPKGWQEPELKGEIPPPINLLLPNRIVIHPFTGTQIVERGQHHGLLELGGMYRRMWDLQQQIR